MSADRARIASMIVRIPADALLSAIWYPDGSGVWTGIDCTACPSEYEIRAVEIEGSNVLLTLGLKAVRAAGVGA